MGIAHVTITSEGRGDQWFCIDPLRGPHGPFGSEGEALRAAVARVEELGPGASVARAGDNGAPFWTFGELAPIYP
jgi:hypothetical protein